MLEDEMGRVPQNEGLIDGGDVNSHIGSERTGMEEVMGCYGFGHKNGEREVVFEFCKNHNLRILNTYFKKDREKLITFKSGGNETQTDLILMRKMEGIKVLNCKSIPGEACLTQHRMVRADLEVNT